MEEEDFVEDRNVSSEDESEGEDERHEKLLRAVSRPNRNNIRASERSETTNVVSEFSLSKRGDENKVDLDDLLNPLGKTISLVKIRKTISKKKQKSKTLDTPLPKQVEQKIARKATYDKVCKEVSKWSQIIQQNRNAEQLHFPLKHANIYVDSLPQLVNNVQMKTPLELEIAALLDEKYKVPEGEKVDPEKAEAVKWTELAMEDALAMKIEMRKIRARQTYQEAKDRKRNKIKSKKYHRILKRERLKKEAKDLEELQKKNPELILEKLEGIQKQRAQERMSLRHRNTGKWAKNALIRNKMNLDSGRAIQEQIELSRALTAKHHVESDFEDEEEITKKTDEKLVNVGVDTANPWFSISTKPTSQINTNESVKNVEKEVTTPVVDYKKYWNKINEEKKKQDSNKRKTKSEDEMEEEEHDFIDEGIKRVKVLKDIKDVDVVKEKSKNAPKKMISLAEKEARDKEKPKAPEPSVEVDPMKFIEVESKTKAMSALPDIYMEDNDIELDDVETSNADNQRNFVAEAFAEDDLVQQFRDEKQAAVEASKPQELNLFLPGWGDWAGDGIKVYEQKRKRFTFVPAEEKIRKDEKLPHVIINEEGEAPLAIHRVNKVPFPFRNKQEYETSIKNAVGKHWNPETAFTRLIAPKIVSRRGTIISPMDSDAISKPKSMSKKKLKLKGTRLSHNKLRIY